MADAAIGLILSDGASHHQPLLSFSGNPSDADPRRSTLLLVLLVDDAVRQFHSTKVSVGRDYSWLEGFVSWLPLLYPPASYQSVAPS